MIFVTEIKRSQQQSIFSGFPGPLQESFDSIAKTQALGMFWYTNAAEILNFSNEKMTLQDDSARSMNMHCNPETISLNVTLHSYTNY